MNRTHKIILIAILIAALYAVINHQSQEALRAEREAAKQEALRAERKKQCHLIIHISAAEAAASATVLAQAPGADNVALALIIGKMTIELAKVFNVSLSDTAIEIGKSTLKQYAGTIALRFASQVIVGWLPVLGNSVNAASMTALVEYIGWDIAENFDPKIRS